MAIKISLHPDLFIAFWFYFYFLVLFIYCFFWFLAYGNQKAINDGEDVRGEVN